MKKILSAMFLVCTFSCSLFLPRTIYIKNNTLNKQATKKIYIKENIVTNLEVKNIETIVKNKKIYSTLSYVYGKNKGILEIETDVVVKDNKIYLKDTKLINSNNGLVFKVVGNSVFKLLDYVELYDFSNKNIEVKSVELLEDSIAIHLKK